MRTNEPLRHHLSRDPAVRRRSVARLLAGSILVGLAGCTMPRTPAVTTGQGEPLASGQPIAGAASSLPRTGGDATGFGPGDATAQQAARDVEELQALRRDAESLGGPFPGSDRETTAGAGVDARPDRIVWNSPADTRTPRRQRHSSHPSHPSNPSHLSPGTVARGPGEDRPATQPPLASPTETIGVASFNPPPTQPVRRVTTGLESEDLELLLVELRRSLFQRSIDSDQPIRELLAIVMMSLVDPEAHIEPDAFRDLTPDEREMLKRFQQFCSSLGRRLDGSTDSIEEITRAVDALRSDLVPEPTLDLPAATLCWRVGGFGDYDEFTKTTFLAHSEQEVILYLEIEGFSSVQNKKGKWLTEVSQQLEIYSEADGMPVWSEPWQKAVDDSAKPRRDFFTVQLITLPKALSVGRYQLKIRVRDEQSGALAEDRIAFEMTADPRMAAKVP